MVWGSISYNKKWPLIRSIFDSNIDSTLLSIAMR